MTRSPWIAALAAALAVTCAREALAQAPAAEPGAPAELDGEALAAMRSACELARPECDPSQLLSPLERRAVGRALDARGLELDPAPYGKRLRTIHVVTQSVFGPEDGFLQWFDIFHFTSRERAIRRDLIVEAGTTWNQRVVDESVRRLRDPTSTALAAAAPVRAAGGAADEVDLLVVTRDVWSIRLNSSWELQNGQLTRLGFSLSENNLFGLRKLLATSFAMDQGAYSIGPLYIDPNLLGRRYDLRGRVAPVFNRDTSNLEGSESSIALSRPLFSLSTEWGAGVAWSHRFAINRAFRGVGLRTYDAPETPEDDMLPHEYQQRRYALALSFVRAFGERVEHRIKAGYELASVRPSLLDDFPADPVLREAFTRDVMPRSERTGVLSIGYEVFEPRFRNYQNVSTFELAEDTRMGASAEATVGLALGAFGSSSDFVRLSGSAAYVGRILHDGLWSARLAGTTRIEDGDPIDNVVELRLRLVSPSFWIGRVVTQLTLSGLFRDSQNLFYTLGGDNGLRGYAIAEFEGDRRALYQIEYRTRPLPVWFMRWGAVVFYDLGGAAQTADDLVFFHDIGLGLRGLIPQTNPDVFRFDLAFPLDPGRAGEVRFVAGFEQSF